MDELPTSMHKASGPTKGEQTREKILQAAENAFAKQGYERATLREVAKVAHIQQPGIYNYFRTKRDLYEAVFERAIAPLIAAFDEIAALPPTDESNSETQLVDLLISNRNIPNLIIRAFLSTNQVERNISVNLVQKVLSHVPTRSHRKHRVPGGMDETLRDMATFNVWFGYFWAAPIIEMLTEKRVDDKNLLESQKKLLVLLAETL